MEAVYNGLPHYLLPSRAQWKTSTRDSAWRGLRHPRSTALGRIDDALQALEVSPTDATFNNLRQHFTGWYNSKLTPAGVLQSRRAPSALHLRGLIQQHRQLLLDRNALMQAVENQLAPLNWKSRVLCAELYDVNNPGPAWGPLQAHVPALQWESHMSSGWARNPPATVGEWSQRGQTELANLATWPALPGGGPGMVLRARMMADIGVAPAAWPPWGAQYVRKGLFCHSCAALAVNAVHANRLVLQAALTNPIRSLDIVHQQAAHVGGMTHWWVCVNRPEELRLENRTIRFTHLADFRYLPLVGGFVIDIWGALWSDQAQHGAAKAGDNNATAPDCVWREPEAAFLGNTATRIHARIVY